jgi:hypothetical protein
MPEAKPPRKKIFISYSHDDEAWFTELKNRLVPLQRVHGFEIWDDKKLTAGQDWHAEIQKALGETKLALLLVSPNFFRSEYIDKHEMKPLQEAHRSGDGITVAPLYVRSADVEDFPFLKSLHALNNPARPLERLKEKQADLDDEFVAISRRIKALMQAPAGGGEATPVSRAAAAPAAAAQPVDDRAEDRAEAPEFDDAGDADDGLSMDQMLAEQMLIMFETEGLQCLDISAANRDGNVMLLRLSEGADANLIVEVAANDELPPDLRLDRRTQRMLVEEHGYAEPELRGDRLCRDFGPIEEVDVGELGAYLSEILTLSFGVPDDSYSVEACIFDL